MALYLHQLSTHAALSHAHVHVVVKTPKGECNELAFNPELSIFNLEGVLPKGRNFLHDFGFIPSTLAEDGDSLDVLLLLETPAFPCVVVEAHLRGALEMERHEPNGTVQRSNLLLAVSASSCEHKDLHSITDLSTERLHKIEHCFHSYSEVKGSKAKLLRRTEPTQAQGLVIRALHTH